MINFEDAVEDMKQAAKKTYAKRGQQVIDANITAINKSVELIDKCHIEYDQKKWSALEITQGFEKLNQYCPEYDSFMTNLVDPVMRR